VTGLVLFALQPIGWLWLFGAPGITLVVAFVLMPLVDAALKPGWRSVHTGLPGRIAAWLPRVYIPLHGLLLGLSLSAAATLDWPALLQLGLAVGTVASALGVTAAHELLHRPGAPDQWLARLLLVSVGYGHFQEEHVKGHHARVATPADPATAAYGVGFYRFLPRSVAGGFRSAWNSEAQRIARGRSGVPVNRVLLCCLASLGLCGLSVVLFGPAGALLFVMQAVWTIVLLEGVNYVEHYGLQRRRIGGRYEAVGAGHSWNADFPLSNWLLLNLQRHTDHHAHPGRPFQGLRSVAAAPQLPASYPAMLLLAMVPPLWFRVMNPRVPPA
jgi:alkane 1-monooxygenase